MASRRDEGISNKPIIVGIGLIASCIAIFVFITGKQSIPELGAPFFTQVAQDSPTRTYTPSQMTPAPKTTPLVTTVPTMTPEPTKSATPLPRGPTSTPQVVNFENRAVSITVYDLSFKWKGNVHFQFSAAKTPLTNVSLLFVPATKDITGRWTWVFKSDFIRKSDPNGVIDVWLEPGDYATVNEDGGAVWNQLMGNWGIQVSNSSGSLSEMIVFPVIAGKETEVVLSLSRLEIGLLSTSGDALKGASVTVYCQGTDIAGKKIPSGRCQWSKQTDATGLATFTFGPGTYMVNVYNWPRDDVYFYDISLGVGQVRREIFKIPR